MKLGYYPGCSLLGSSREYDESFRAIAPQFGLELVEVPDWNCCGASAAHNIGGRLAQALPVRVLALAEKAGLEQLAVPCSACYSRLAGTRHELLHNEALRKEICDVVEMEWTGSTEVLNILEVLTRFVSEELPTKVQKPFEHKVACYYGCYLVRPAAYVACERREDPQAMEELLKKTGAAPLDWAFKVECCGAGLSVSRTDLVGKLSAKILDDAERRGAEAIVVGCPMCHTNLDLRRDEIERVLGKSSRVPVMFVTQVIGKALGLDDRQLGLHRHNVAVSFVEPASAAATPAGGGKTE